VEKPSVVFRLFLQKKLDNVHARESPAHVQAPVFGSLEDVHSLHLASEVHER
jgi:hypothetical protein